jgi:hypothetical protein
MFNKLRLWLLEQQVKTMIEQGEGNRKVKKVTTAKKTVAKKKAPVKKTAPKKTAPKKTTKKK